MNLSEYLTERSKEICADNQCGEDEHNCESYAYITAKMELLDICAPDFFQGCSGAHAAISLPWSGTQADLEDEVLDQCADELREEGSYAHADGIGRGDGPYSGEAETIWQEGWDEAKRRLDVSTVKIKVWKCPKCGKVGPRHPETHISEMKGVCTGLDGFFCGGTPEPFERNSETFELTPEGGGSTKGHPVNKNAANQP
jgi:hypothetical protein